MGEKWLREWKPARDPATTPQSLLNEFPRNFSAVLTLSQRRVELGLAEALAWEEVNNRIVKCNSNLMGLGYEEVRDREGG